MNIDKINKLMKKSLTNFEILKLIGNRANLVPYPTIKKYKSLDSLLGVNKACIILYETQKRYGHWCCIFQLPCGMIEFFDPYGLMPDKELAFINKEYKNTSNQNYPYLTKLMIDSPYKLSYNQHKFQKMKPGVNSCGRWVVSRLLFRFLQLNEFKKLFFKNKNYSPDVYVTALTHYV